MKKILLSISISFMLIFCTGRANAFLKAKDSKEQAYIVGYDSIEIINEEGIAVYNSGNIPCYIRVAIDVSDSDKEELCSFEDLPGANWETKYLAGDKGMCGYYYYTVPIASHELSSKLFSGVLFSDDTVSKSDITVYAESIQGPPYDDYEEAWSNYIN